MREKGARGGGTSNSLDNVHNTDWTQGNPESAVKLFRNQLVGTVGETVQDELKTLGAAGFRKLENYTLYYLYKFT